MKPVLNMKLEPPPTQRNLRKACNAGFRAAAEYWVRHLRRKHFTKRAMTEYGYTPRAKWYNAFKQRKTHRQLPLVYSGLTRQTVKQRTKVTATYKGSKVRQYAPALNLVQFNRGKHRSGASELRAFSRRDGQLFAKRFGMAFEKIILSPTGKRSGRRRRR